MIYAIIHLLITLLLLLSIEAFIVCLGYTVSQSSLFYFNHEWMDKYTIVLSPSRCNIEKNLQNIHSDVLVKYCFINCKLQTEPKTYFIQSSSRYKGNRNAYFRTKYSDFIVSMVYYLKMIRKPFNFLYKPCLNGGGIHDQKMVITNQLFLSRPIRAGIYSKRY